MNLGELKTFRAVDFLKEFVLFQQAFFEFFAKKRPVAKIRDTDAGTRGLIGITGADASPGGADFCEAFLGLAQAVACFMIRKDKVGPVADEETPFDRDPFLIQVVNFLQQRVWVNHHAVSDHAANIFVKNSRRNKMQHKLTAFLDNRMTRIVAALVADDVIRVLGEDVDDFSLAFVAPLRADNDGIGHVKSEIRNPKSETNSNN